MGVGWCAETDCAGKRCGDLAEGGEVGVNQDMLIANAS